MLALLALLAGCGGGGGDNGGGGGGPATVTLTGFVKEASTGIPLQGRSVVVQGNTTPKAVIQPDGGFTLPDVPNTTVTLVVEDDCNQPYGTRVINVKNGTITNDTENVGTITIDLSASPPPVCL